MLLATWEVRIGKNCDWGVENAAEAEGQGQHFQAQGHSFSLYGPTLDNNILIFFSCGKLAYGRTSGFVYETLSLNWLYAPFANKQNQQANQRVFTKQRKVY